MKHQVALTITSLLSILFTTFHLTDDIVYGISPVREEVGGLRDEMHSAFDALAQRFERLETEYHMLVAGTRRLEEQD